VRDEGVPTDKLGDLLHTVHRAITPQIFFSFPLYRRGGRYYQLTGADSALSSSLPPSPRPSKLTYLLQPVELAFQWISVPLPIPYPIVNLLLNSLMHQPLLLAVQPISWCISRTTPTFPGKKRQAISLNYKCNHSFFQHTQSCLGHGPYPWIIKNKSPLSWF